MAGYVRQDTSNNIANGSVIDADDLDGEFDAIAGAFSTATGHTHDGSTAEGAPIVVIGPAQEYLSDGTALYPKADDTYDLGKVGAEWKNLYIDGVANIDSLVADTADINGGTADSLVIGGTTPAAGTFTSITASSADINGGTIDGTTVGAAVPAAGAFTTLTTTGAVDINSGNIDGTAIGAASPSTGAFTNISATGNITVTGTVDGRDVATDGAKLDTITPADLVTLTGTQTLTNKTLNSVVLNDGYTEEVFAVTGTTPALSPVNGSIQTWTLSGNSTPTAGTWAAGQSITLLVDDGTDYTITWTSLSIVWKTDGGSAPALNTTGDTVIVLWKVGSTIYGARVGNA